MPDLSGPRADFHLCGTEFLLRDLDLALTFLDLAEASVLPEQEKRASGHALTAYRTIQRFLPKLRPGPERQQMIQEKLALLTRRMIMAGVIPEEFSVVSPALPQTADL